MSEKTLSLAGYKCQTVSNVVSGVPIVFLHGLSYTSKVWQRINAIDLLKEKHLPFLALDMPYGQKSECHPKTRDAQANVDFAKEAVQNVFGAEVPVLVGASLGGNVAIKYAIRFPVKGLLLVAPARTLQEDLVQNYSQFKFPVRIICGSEDKIVSLEELRTLAGKLPKAKLVVYEGAEHAAYIDYPDRFKRDLLELYALAEQS